MGVSYTTAAERDLRRTRDARWRFGHLDAALAGVSLFAIILLIATYHGRFRALEHGARGAAAVSVHLNQVSDAVTLEPVLAPLFETAGDSRLAARELFAFLVQDGGGRRTLKSVRALAQARVTAETIDRSPGALAYRARLAADRQRAVNTRQPAPDSVPLLDGAEMAQLRLSLRVRDRSDVRRALVLWGALYVIAFHMLPLVWRARGIDGDRLLLTIAHALTVVGLALMVSRIDPLRDELLFIRFAQGVVIGLSIAAALSLIALPRLALHDFSYLPLLAAVLLSVVLFVFGDGPGGSRAKVNLGPIQPTEAIRILLALFLAGYFARNWELLRAVRVESLRGVRLPLRLSLPSARYAAPVLAGVGVAVGFFFLQRDLGPALILALVFLAAYAVARGTVGLAIAGLVLLTAGFYAGYRLGISPTLADRVRMWESPWDNIARGGDQVAHAYWALASGGATGSGPGLGDTRYVPAGHTDLILAAAGEELGAIGVLALAVLYGALVWRAGSDARKSRSDYGFFLGLVLMLFFAVPVLWMAAGILGLAPLTGVVTPFLSYGGSAMVANFVALALLAGIRSEAAAPADTDVLRRPVRVIAALCGVAGVAVTMAALRVQTMRADDYAVRPQLGLQADGARRYQYNPRLLDVARRVPRGTIFDRNGLPLATDDGTVLREAAAAYRRIGVAVKSECADADARCYPLGGRAYHLLGDARSRVNWSASNSSYVERDSEARLRGYDDHQMPVHTTNGDGVGSWTVRRDYSELLPLLRHRYDPEHRAVKAFLARRRDVRLTIDAPLQVKVAAIVANAARRSSTGRAAAVVLDADTGEIRAAVSYPWPSDETFRRGARRGGDVPDAWLDRARYGLYPPGSTFKLITTAAALLEPSARNSTFTCTRLPDERVGARIPGWARPVRDDVLERTPHGTIGLERALVISCNAYFAQLAVQLGPVPLLRTAARVDVSLARGNDPKRLRNTLPHAGYGQGEVLASPMRMALVAAAIASGGALREAHLEPGQPTGAPRVFLPADSARELGAWMRRVVVEGTGRSLSGHPIAIAGKTGTAEIAGAPSHAWFVGYAPADRPGRIAFAVVVENAGYGGRAAAPAAGEIVSAAAATGLLR
ncbi:MAG TPA: FtsW/RodA/SpoVE family cell cycle protein [Vicinamibacterales bacterium]|nr:FtsW/RodA/SpoVE family cell cycle protein [Vicinamibacterales bacterium]